MKYVPSALFLLMSVTMPFSVPAQTVEVTIGFIGPLSGEGAGYGNEARNAVTMAVEEINNRGEIPGVRLRTVFEDGKCAGRESLAAAQKLLTSDGVRMIIGGICSSETLAAARVTEPAGVILLTPFSSNPEITRAGEFVFRNCVNDLEGGRGAAQLVRDLGFRRPAVISEQSDYCLGLRGSFIDSLKKEAIPLAADETFLSSEVEFRTILAKIRAREPDVLVINPQTGVKGGMIVKQLRTMGWKIPVLGNNVFSSVDAAEAAGGQGALEGIKFVDAPEVSSEQGKALLEKYQQRFGPVQSTFLVAFAWDDAWLLAQAVRAVGTDTAKIRDYILSLPVFHGVAYDYHFDENGDMQGVPYAVKEIRDGRVAVLGSGKQ